MSRPSHSPNPLSTILQNRKASIELHKFLLGSLDGSAEESPKDSTEDPLEKKIKVESFASEEADAQNKTLCFKVKIINLHPAPSIHGDDGPPPTQPTQ